MRKIIIAAAALLSLAGTAQADSFSVNSLPLSGFATAADNVQTGSIAAKKRIFKRVVARDGVEVTQYYTLSENGAAKVFSEEAN